MPSKQVGRKGVSAAKSKKAGAKSAGSGSAVGKRSAAAKKKKTVAKKAAKTGVKRGPGRPPKSAAKASGVAKTKKTRAVAAKKSSVGTAKRGVGRKKPGPKPKTKLAVAKSPVLEKKRIAVSKTAQSVDKARTRSDVVNVLALSTSLPRKDVKLVLEVLTELIEHDLGRKGPGVFAFNGLLKITKVKKKAVKARKGINPFTKEPTVFKAKPAQTLIKIRPLKGLKTLIK